MTHKTAIVGNANLSRKHHELINDFDRVIRFNTTSNVPDTEIAKTSELWLACSAKQIGEYLRDGTYLTHPAFQNCTSIVAPLHSDVVTQFSRPLNWLDKLRGRQQNWRELCQAVAKRQGKNFIEISKNFYLETCEALNVSGYHYEKMPSSGFLAIRRELRSETVSQLHVFGFGFTGWHGHDWAAELHAVSTYESQGRLVYHAPEQ